MSWPIVLNELIQIQLWKIRIRKNEEIIFEGFEMTYPEVYNFLIESFSQVNFRSCLLIWSEVRSPTRDQGSMTSKLKLQLQPWL